MSRANTPAISTLIGAFGAAVLGGVLLIGPAGPAQAATPAAAADCAAPAGPAAGQPDQGSADSHTSLLGRGHWGGHRYWGNDGWHGNWNGGWGNGWGNGQGNGWGDNGWGGGNWQH